MIPDRERWAWKARKASFLVKVGIYQTERPMSRCADEGEQGPINI
jgi:hypothetical protein